MTEKEMEDRLERERAKRREYYRTHKEQIAANQKRYRENHRQQIRDYQRAYRAANPLMVEKWKRNSAIATYFKIMAEKEQQKAQEQNNE